MTRLAPIMGRAAETDGEGDLVPVTDATAYFYVAGSSTPLTVYTDSSLATPRGTSVAADSDGIFPQCWTSESLIKMDVKDGDGISLDGFPQDNFPTLSVSGTTASLISFSPVTGNSATDVQTAIANNVARINTLDNASRLPTSAGSGGVFTLTSTYSISAYAAGQEYEFIANQASVGSGTDTLNVDSVGAAVIKKYDSAGSKADLAAGDISIGKIVRVKHDGTHFVLTNAALSSETVPGLVEAATTAETTSGTANKFPDAAKIAARYEPVWTYSSVGDLTNSGANDLTVFSFTSLPSGLTEIEVIISDASLSGTDGLLVQLSTSATFATTGYESNSATDGGLSSSTAGMIVRSNSGTEVLHGVMFLRKQPSTNLWINAHSINAAGGGGGVTLGGTLDGVRLTVTGANTFDGGSIWLRYK